MVFTGLSIGIILSVSRGEQDQHWGKQTTNEEVKVKEKNMDAKAA